MNMNRKMRDEYAVLLVFLQLLRVESLNMTMTSGNVTKMENENYVVFCKGNDGHAVTWRGPRGLLGVKTHPKVQISSYGTKIFFDPVLKEDTGYYTCSAGPEKKAFYLKVIAAIEFMDTLANQTGVEGMDVTLRCEVRGGKVTWSVENGDISDKSKYIEMGDGLLIKNVHRSDSGTYVCTALQESTGATEDRKIRLRVMHKPSFTHSTYAKEEIVWGYLNGTVNLTCIVIAVPSARFEWNKDNTDRQKIGRYIKESDDVSILQLIVDESTFGNYKCIATNPYGTLEKHFSLVKGAKPHPPKSLDLRRISASFLDLKIVGPEPNEGQQQMGAGMQTMGFSVQYRNKNTSEWGNREFDLSEENIYHLANLVADTEYDVRAATRNAAGLSDFTNTSTFRTSPSHANHKTFSPTLNITVNLIMFLLFTQRSAF